MPYPAGFLDELRNRVSLAEVVGRRVTLQKRGREYTGLCPFHKEKTPSFHVVEEKGFYHCLAAETEVITADGVIPIAELAGKTATILTRGGKWQDAAFRSYGRQRLYRIELSRNGVRKILHATSGHRWFVRGRVSAAITTELKPGHRLESVWPAKRAQWKLDSTGVRHGIVFGDGTIQRKGGAGYGTVNLHDVKADDLAAWFADYRPTGKTREGGHDYLRVYGGRDFEHMKCLPPATSSEDYMLGFIAGYVATDGHVAKDGTVILNSTDSGVLDEVRAMATRLGIGTFSVTSQTRQGYLAAEAPIFRVHFVNASLDPDFFLRCEARARFQASAKRFARLRWVVRSVAETDRVEEVFCAEVDGEHAFALADNILTGNCFGCGAHGDVIGFSMRALNMEFREAVESLANQAGLRIPEETPAERQRAARAATLQDACEAACVFFHKQLREPGGLRAVEYLNHRGVTSSSINAFRLGWAPDSRDSLKRALIGMFPEDLLVAAGLLRRPEKGESFDFFRGRVIFPICDRGGKVIAFGGRTLGDGQPKYLNSPDTPIFDKGRTLYGYNLVRSAKSLAIPPIIVEGYMDVVSLHEAGFNSAMAPLGTALTETQILELWKLAPDPIICFDGDQAGQRAAGRALDRALPLLRPENRLRFVILPPTEDPDSLIRSKGKEVFRRYIDRALEASQFLWEINSEGKPLEYYSTPERTASLQGRLTYRISKIDNDIVQKNFQHFAWDKIWDIRRELRRKRKLLSLDKAAERKISSTLAALRGLEDRVSNIEILLVSIAINHPEIILEDVDSFASLEINNEVLREMWQSILENIGGKTAADTLVLRNALEDKFGDFLERLFQSPIFRGCSFAHFGADREWALRGWKAILAKHRLPRLEVERDDAIARWSTEANDANLAILMVYREMIAQCVLEEGLLMSEAADQQAGAGHATIH